MCVVDCLKMKLQDGTSKYNDKESVHVFRMKTKWFTNRMAVILIRIKRKENEKIACFVLTVLGKMDCAGKRQQQAREKYNKMKFLRG